MSLTLRAAGGPHVLWAQWAAPPGVHALVTTRDGGVSTGDYESQNFATHVGDEPNAVALNRARLRTRLGLPQEPLWLNQVHGTGVAIHPGPGREPATPPAADAAVTRDRGCVLAVLTADCLPVAFAADDGSVVGLAHAGWRGLAAGVLGATVAAMGVAADRCVAWLGPAIERAAFEVGADVRAAFLSRNEAFEPCFRANARGRWQADLAGLATLELGRLGLRDVRGSGLGTYADAARWYSFRRQGRCGRMATLVWTDAPGA